MRILLTNVGRRTYFIDYLNDLIKNNKDIEIYISDRTNKVASYYTNISKFLVLPKVIGNHKNYINSLLKKCYENKIDLIIPLSDLDLLPLSLNKSKFKKFNCDILVSKPKIIKICENKFELNNFLKKLNIKFPYQFESIKDMIFPLISKPLTGSGSKNIFLYKKKNELPSKLEKSFIYQRFIKGQEYGLDILNDFDGRFVSYCLKKKIEMRSGETDKAITVNNKRVLNLSKKISQNLRHIGNLDCDLIIDKNNNIFILDFNCRFGGGYPFTHSVGHNFIEYLINQKLGLKNSKFPLKYKEKFIAKGIKIFNDY
ncbi:MAG: hypothetical protein CMG07_02160 [Candidatus Marinimicrobia bacterium]|nr:hypothetical protein [Candidatus Neomarinimicrobiota bacterium]